MKQSNCCSLVTKKHSKKEKYVEYEDIQGSVDIYDRSRNTPLEFKTTRASDIKEPKSFHVEQLKLYGYAGVFRRIRVISTADAFRRNAIQSLQNNHECTRKKGQREKLVTEITSLKRAMKKVILPWRDRWKKIPH